MKDYAIAWCGCDVSKATFDAALAWTEKENIFSKMTRATFGRNAEGVDNFVLWLDREVQAVIRPVRVIMEATGRYSLQLAKLLVEKRPSLLPAIVNPRQAAAYHQSQGLRNKTDMVDARSLALMGRERRPQPYAFSSKEQEELRDLTRYRQALVTQRTQEQLRAGEIPPKSPAGRLIAKNLRHLQEAVKRGEAAIEKAVARSQRLAQDVALLTTIPGIGSTTAAMVIAELGDLSQYKRSRQISAMAGLCPRIRSSGKRQGRTVMSKKGNAHVRAGLFLPAQAAARFNPHMKAFYLRLCQTKKKKVALGAVMRKLLVLMRALIISRQPYCPDFTPADFHRAPVETVSKTHPKLRFVPKFSP